MTIPTVLVLPFPLQGHVNPMMRFSEKLVDQGCNIIFVNSDFIHERVVSSMEKPESLNGSPIKLVSIPDGLRPDHNRSDLGELCVSILGTMPPLFEKFIQDITLNGGIRINCIVADGIMGWALEVASKLGIKAALFWPASAAMFALTYNAHKLIDDGIIDSDGSPITKEIFLLSSSIPCMNMGVTWWSNIPDPIAKKRLFNTIVHCMHTPPNLTEWWLCNTTYELEPGALSFVPKLLPVGPLLRSNDNTSATARSMGQLWKEDLSSINWLDQQPYRSVLYVAFGSITLFDEKQFTELALGLELTNRPFLWVVRQDPNSNNKLSYPNEFKGNQGKIVGWAPQEKVLSHPAMACFVTHCGWNSVIEGLSNEVPFLCWPYFADQFYDKAYICDELKVGLGLDSDEIGLISREEIKAKVEQLLSDENIKLRCRELKEKLKKNVGGGKSLENFFKFFKWLKD